MNPQRLIVDVCGTLVLDDTTLGLLAFHFARQPRKRWRSAVIRSLTGRFSPVRLSFALVELVTGRHWLKNLAVRMLAGDYVSELDGSARDYAEFLLSRRRIESVWEILQAKRQEGCTLILASASLEPVVSALAQSLGAAFVASSLEQDNGRLTGKFEKDVTGLKFDALTLLLGEDLSERGFIALSDNLTDRILLERADEAFVVLHKASHRHRWGGLTATHLKVNK